MSWHSVYRPNEKMLTINFLTGLAMMTKTTISRTNKDQTDKKLSEDCSET